MIVLFHYSSLSSFSMLRNLEKKKVRQSFFLHFSLGRQDNYLQEFPHRRKKRCWLEKPKVLLLMRCKLMNQLTTRKPKKKLLMWQWSRYYLSYSIKKAFTELFQIWLELLFIFLIHFLALSTDSKYFFETEGSLVRIT